jgi:hypothetical protein
MKSDVHLCWGTVVHTAVTALQLVCCATIALFAMSGNTAPTSTRALYRSILTLFRLIFQEGKVNEQRLLSEGYSARPSP